MIGRPISWSGIIEPASAPTRSLDSRRAVSIPRMDRDARNGSEHVPRRNPLLNLQVMGRPGSRVPGRTGLCAVAWQPLGSAATT